MADKGNYLEVIVRLVGLHTEPEGPAVVGVIVRLPHTTGDSFPMLEPAVMLAHRTAPALSVPAKLFKVEAMLGGRWHAEEGDDEDDDE